MPDKLIKHIATGFGLGHSKIMPGTVGTLWGIPLAWAVMSIPGIALQIAACITLTLVSIPICAKAEKLIGGKDPSCVVADEFMTLPICYLGLPFSWPVIATGFVLHRIFDITKPPPIRQLQNIKGGVGIVIDDFLAALIALGCNHLIYHFLLK